MIRNDINMFSSTKIVTKINKNIIFQGNPVSDAKKIKEEQKSYIEKNEQIELKYG